MNKIQHVTLPNAVWKYIYGYTNMKLGKCKINVPYYRNKERVRASLRVLVGKGSPEEIQYETIMYARLKGLDLKKTKCPEIREFMISQGIGIDCSGFVVHMIDFYLDYVGLGSIRKVLRYDIHGLYGWLKVKLRPICNTSAATLTSTANTKSINIKNVLPMDMIKLSGLKRGDHVALITDVWKNGVTKKLRYIHSSEHYKSKGGVRFGEIVIVNANRPLEEQQWKEVDKDNTCWTLQQYKKCEGRGMCRLRVFSKYKLKKVNDESAAVLWN